MTTPEAPEPGRAYVRYDGFTIESTQENAVELMKRARELVQTDQTDVIAIGSPDEGYVALTVGPGIPMLFHLSGPGESDA